MNIKKMLREQAKDVLPDERIKENVKYRLGLDGDEGEVELGNTRAKARNRKIAISAGVCVLAAAIVCAFIPLMRGNSDTHRTPSPGVFGELSTAEEIYGFSAATAGMVISGLGNAASAAAFSARATDGQTQDDEIIDTINGYMELVESLVSGNAFTVEGGDNTDASYEYQYVMHISYTGINDEEREGGVIYYNRTDVHTETDGDETETEYTLEGVMVQNGREYPLYGTHTEETESGESEAEYKMTVTLDGNMYLIVEQSAEHENEDGETEREIEYSYTLREGAPSVRGDDDERQDYIWRTTFSYESEEGDETELEMSVHERGQPAERFYFKNEDGVIRVRLEGEQSAAYTVAVIDGQYVYFKDGQEVDRGDRD